MSLGKLAGHQVRLKDAGLVVAPLLVPDVLVLEDLGDDGSLSAVEPDLAKRFDCRLEPVDHTEDSNGRAQSVGFANVEVGTVEVEGAVVGGLLLPVDIADVNVVNSRILCAGLVQTEVLVLDFVQVRQRQVW